MVSCEDMFRKMSKNGSLLEKKEKAYGRRMPLLENKGLFDLLY